MFTELQLQNFKSWSDTGNLRLAPITAFFGANSSGKTSLLQSLLLLRQTSESSDRNRVLDLGGPTTLIDLGTYQDIQHQHSSDNRFFIRLGWSDDTALDIVDLLKRARKKSSTLIHSHYLALEAAIDLTAADASVEHVTYTVGEARFTLARREALDGYDLEANEFDFVRAPGRAWPLPSPTRFYGFPDQVRLYYQNASFLSDLELRFEQACARILYLGPLREDPQRQYIFSGGAPSDVGKRGQLGRVSLAEAVSGGWLVHVP